MHRTGNCLLVARRLSITAASVGWRRWLGVWLPLCAGLLLGSPASAAVPAAEPLVFLGDRNLPPYEFIENEVPKGANVDLVRAIGRVLGRPVEVQLTDWGQAQSRLLAGEGNALTFLGRTEQRENQYDFSLPTLPASFALFVRTGQQHRFDPQRLQGKRIGVINGSLPYQFFSENQPQATLVMVDNAIDGTKRLLRGEFDALAANAWSELYLLEELHITGVTELAPFNERKGNIAVRKGDEVLRSQIDRALTQLQESGEFDQIIDRWSSQKVHLFSEAAVRTAEVAGCVAALALLLLSVALTVLYRKHAALRREVAQRQRIEQEREQLLTQVGRQKAFLECLMANAHTCIAVMAGSELRYTFVNPAYQALAPDAPMLGRCYRDIFPQAAQDGAEQQLRQVWETGQPWSIESYRAPAPGKPDAVWEGQAVRVSTDESEQAILVITWEVTERVRAEQARQASTATLQAILNATQESVWLFSNDGMVLMGNQMAVARLDRPPEQVIGKSIFELLPPPLAESRYAHLQQVASSGEPFDFEDQRNDIEFHHRFYPVFNEHGKVANIACFSRDITSYRQASQALQQSQERLRLAQQIGQIGTFEVDLVNRVSRWTPELEALYGVPSGTFGDSHQAWRDRVHPDDLAALDRLTRITRETGDFDAEWRTTWPDGSLHWLAGRAKLYTDEAGRAVRLLGVNIDITERKRAEQALTAAVDEAERANNAKSRFLAAASHDLRQPLSALSMYVGVLTVRLGQEHAALVGNMKDCLASLSELLTDLLDISKLEAGVVVPHVSEFAVADLLARTCAAHLPEAQQKRLRLKAVATDWIGRTDPVLYGRLLGNLVSNAVRYTERGGVLVACRRRGGKAWVEVWDSGIGIPADKTSEIFEEFRQLGDDARNRGSGLGLAIVARTAGLLGLQIRIRSQPGRGSLFAVELPLGSRAEMLASAVPPLQPLRIALVEDNAIVAESVQYALVQHGHSVVAATSGAQLLARLQQASPDIVISDYRLAGGESGYDVITAVRAVFGPDLPAFILTGDTDPKLIRSMASKGIRVHHKPLELDALQACIAEIVVGSV